MKKILTGAVAAIALVGIASPAAAQNHVGTAQLHYAGTAPIPYTITNPGIGGTILGEAGVAARVGTRYTALAIAPNDTETALPTVTTTFTLTGRVNRDCSFYAGNNSSATNIDFGVIGVRTGNNENVNSAFEMAGPAFANVETLTAGCNFNNEVEITKSNVNGLVNSAAGGYDTDEFQANIPYSVTAAWTGVPVNTVTSGTGQTLNVSTSQLSNLIQQGAWRSNMTINFNAPAITNKGLVAGNYSGTTTLVLRAL